MCPPLCNILCVCWGKGWFGVILLFDPVWGTNITHISEQIYNIIFEVPHVHAICATYPQTYSRRAHANDKHYKYVVPHRTCEYIFVCHSNTHDNVALYTRVCWLACVFVRGPPTSRSVLRNPPKSGQNNIVFGPAATFPEKYRYICFVCARDCVYVPLESINM